MSARRGLTTWLSENVIVAVIGGVAAVAVAALGLVGVMSTDRDRRPPRLEPMIVIRETSFKRLPEGQLEIRVAGWEKDFGPKDRLYAIAKEVTATVWWVSGEVVPGIDGEWVALINARDVLGKELTVFAVRIPGETYSPIPGISPVPAPDASSAARKEIEDDLRAAGPAAVQVDGLTAIPLPLPAP
jgi:hypothetical protein